MPDAYDQMMEQIKAHWRKHGDDPSVIKMGRNRIKSLKNAVNVSPEGAMSFKGVPVELHEKPNGVEFMK